MAVVKNLMIRAGADFSGMRREMQKARSDLQNFKNNISNTMKGIAGALAAVGVGAIFTQAAKDAMTFEASVMQVNRTMGMSAKAFEQWAKDNAAAFGLSRKEAMQYGAVFSNLISTFEKSAAGVSKHTQDLLQASAVVAAATGRTLEDTMERIRSGMLGNTEAIEDLGIFVGISMIESTEAFRRFAGDQSWAQLDFQTQQQIRLFAILEQATMKYGDTVANNTNSKMNQFTAALGNVRLALGQAFLPILNVVLPILTRLANALATIMNVVAQFTQALFGKSTTSGANAQTQAFNTQAGAVSGLGDAYNAAGKAANKAGKEAKKAAKAVRGVAGFDEVHTLAESSGGSDSSDSGSGGGGGGIAGGGIGGGGELLPDMGLGGFAESTVQVSEKVREMANRVKAAFAEMSSFIKTHKDIIIAALAGVGAALATVFIASRWAGFVAGIKALFVGLGSIIAAVLSPIGLIVAAIAGAVAAFVYFYRTNEGFRGVVDRILKAIGDAAKWLWKEVLVPLGAFVADAFVRAWKGLTTAVSWLWKNVMVPLGDFMVWFWKKVIVPLGAILIDVLGVAFQTVADIAKSFWEKVLVPLGEAMSESIGPAVEALSAVFGFLWEKALKPIAAYLKEIFMTRWEALIAVLQLLWDNVLKPLAKYLGEGFKQTFNTVFDSLGQVITGLKTAFIGLMNFITGVFTGDWKRAWEGVKDIFKGVFTSLYAIVKTPLNLIIDAINEVIGGLNKIKIDLPDWMPGGGKSFGVNIPKIPKLARGGVVDSRTHMGNYIAGEAGSELIVPLENTSFTDKIASALGTAVMTAMQMGQSGSQGRGGNGDVVIQLDGTTLARVLNPYLSREQGRLGSSAIIQPI